MERRIYIPFRGLPKTGQTILYAANDDARYQAGWWTGRTVSGNKTRFVSLTIEGDDIVLDRATGLIWAADGNAAGCNNGGQITWGDALDYQEFFTFAGFSDWRIPNINELASIVRYSGSAPFIDTTFFPNTKSYVYWSSTTYSPLTTQAYWYDFGCPAINIDTKTEEHYMRLVRGGL